MNKYELMYIIDMQLEEAPRKELVDRVTALITSNGGTVDKIDEWGKRRLAYTINYKTEGYYVLVNFSAVGDLPREIERVLQISESVLRYLIVRLEEKQTSVKPRAVPVRPAFSRPPVYEPEGDAEAKETAVREEAPAVETPVVETPAVETPAEKDAPAASADAATEEPSAAQAE